MPRTLLAIASTLALVAAASAQTTYSVGPGGFAQIDNALAVAAPGDVILVQAGSYAACTTSIGVTIRGITPSVVVQSITANVPANQSLHLVNMTVNSPVAITGGRATIDSCALMNGCVATQTKLHVQSTIVGATLLAPGGGLRAISSTVTASDSEFQGRPSYGAFPLSNTFSSAAIDLMSSTFQGSHLLAHGGNSTDFGLNSLLPSPGVRATSTLVWISDSTIEGGIGHPSAPTACATNITQGRLSRCTLTPSCTPGVPLTGPMLGCRRPTPLQSPGPFTLEFRTDPNALVGVFFAAGLGTAQLPGLEQPILLDFATTHSLALLIADSTGLATGTWNVPASLTNLPFFFQGIGTAAAPAALQMSPVVGGVVR